MATVNRAGFDLNPTLVQAIIEVVQAATEVGEIQPPVSGATVVVASSRLSIAADNGATLELAAGITYTLDSAVALPAGVAMLGPAAGTATLAVTGSATTNGATTALTVAAGATVVAVPRGTSASAYVVSGA